MSRRYTIKQLMERPKQTTERTWVVEGLLRTRTKRASLLAGFAEAGKSTFATQLAIAVSQGIPILDRETEKSPVIFWRVEDNEDDTLDDFIKAGTVEHDPITIVLPDAEDDNITEVHNALLAQPSTRLVIIETLSDFFNVEDITSSDEAKRHLAKLNQRLAEPFPDCVFLILAHFNKTDLNTDMSKLSITRVFGSQGWVAGTASKIYLQQVSDADTRRFIIATARRGRNIEPTYLVFDRNTNTSTLGKTVKEEMEVAKQTAKLNRASTSGDTLINTVRNNQGLIKGDLKRKVGGNGAAVGREIEAKIKEGVLKVVLGPKNSKFIYTYDYIPGSPRMEDAADDDAKFVEEMMEGAKTV